MCRFLVEYKRIIFMKIGKKIYIVDKHQKWLNLFSCTIVLNGVSIKFTIKVAKSVRRCSAGHVTKF